MTTAVLIIVVAALSWLIVRGIRSWALRRQVLDIPNDRSSHARPVPVGGGLAIVLICLTGWLGLVAFHLPDWPDAIYYALGAIAIAAVSWVDDVRSVSTGLRFVVHSLAAIILILGCGYWTTVSVPLAGHVPLGWLGLPLVFFWIVGLTNAYNFMDGIDGIAASQASIAGVGWMMLGAMTGQPAMYTLALLVAASSLGFLIHNWQPARIFMGDVGSAFLGFTFAFLTLKAGKEDPRLVLASALLVWPFIFDTVFTFLRRLLKRESVFSAHRSHLYQRLVLSGLSHATVTLLYIGLDLVGLLLAVLLVRRPQAASGLIVVAVPLLACGLWTTVILRERKALWH